MIHGSFHISESMVVSLESFSYMIYAYFHVSSHIIPTVVSLESFSHYIISTPTFMSHIMPHSHLARIMKYIYCIMRYFYFENHL